MCLVFVSCIGDHRELHVLTHSFPTRRSSDLAGVSRASAASSAASLVSSPGGKPPHPCSAGAAIDNRTAHSAVERIFILDCWGLISGPGRPDRKSTRLNSSH